jgi:transcriptional regulator with XRE-family HTH domain
MKRHDPATALQAYVAANGASQKQAAKAMGISQSYLSDLLAGRRRCPDTLLAKLGLERIVVRAPAAK